MTLFPQRPVARGQIRFLIKIYPRTKALNQALELHLYLMRYLECFHHSGQKEHFSHRSKILFLQKERDS